MKRSLGKFFIKVAIAILAVVVFYNCYSAWLTDQINQLYQKRQIAVNHSSGKPEKDKGNIILQEALKGNNLVFLGSSELTAPVPENPRNMMPNNLYSGDVIYAGHAHVQNALHAMNVGANSDAFSGKDIAIIESLQWYQGEDTPLDAFFSNFSELQLYEFLHNSRISDESKNYLCRRYVQLESGHKEDAFLSVEKAAEENSLWNTINTSIMNGLKEAGYELVEGEYAYQESYILAETYSGNNIVDKIIYQLLRPYYYLRYKVLSLKDKYNAYQWLKSISEEDQREPVMIDWEEVYRTADAEGKVACTNNDLYVYDEYYTDYLEEKWEKLKDRDKDTPLLESKEWDDYEFFLQVCKELGLKPYIVSMSTNGRYYDYIGMGKEKRDSLYDRIAQLSNEYGFDCLKTGDKEYEPYFYCDVMHLGWKGWPYVLQNIIEHFEEQDR